MRWVSLSGEFAFLSVGGAARGIFAIGGVAYGIVAIGGVASAGVISIGMNAAGSVAALGMNAVAPISLSVINGVGFYSLAGVNAWGAWSDGGTNSTGLSSHGGVNSDYSMVPAVLIIVLLIVVSSVARGKRERRKGDGLVALRLFLRSPELREAHVRARLAAVSPNAIDLQDGRDRVAIPGSAELARSALAIWDSCKTGTPAIAAHLQRVDEEVIEVQKTSYRERPHARTESVLSCSEIDPAPERETWLPKDWTEVQWVIAWAARLAAVVAIGILVYWAR
jgi:hypothetical protein